MKEYNYFCTNSECLDKFSNRWISLSEEQSREPILCLKCLQEMKCVGHRMQAGGFLSFESKTPEQKREIMHKRSVDHFKKTDKGDLANYKQTITNDLKRKAEGRG